MYIIILVEIEVNMSKVFFKNFRKETKIRASGPVFLSLFLMLFPPFRPACLTVAEKDAIIKKKGRNRRGSGTAHADDPLL